MSFPMGLTDGMGTVVEEDELDSFVNTVGGAVSANYDVTPITPEGGGNYVPPAPDAGSSYFDEGIAPPAPEPSYDPWMDEQLYTPPAPPPIQTGSQFFGDPDVPAVDEPWTPNITYVSNDDYFGSIGSPDPLGMGFTEQGPSDTLQSGFGEWLDNQINVAIRDGNEQQYNDLIALFNQQGEGPADLYLRGMMDQMGTPELQDTTIDPMAYFGIDRAGVRAGEMPGVFMDEARRQASADYWGLPSFAGQHGDPFATGQFEDYRDFAMTQDNLRFNNDASFLPGVIERGLGIAGTALGGAAQGTGAALRFIGNSGLSAFGREVTGGDVATLAWQALNVPAERGFQGLTYAATGQRYLLEQLAEETGIPVEIVGSFARAVDFTTGNLGGANYERGDSLTSTVKQSYSNQPWYVRVSGESLYDPWNVIGAGAVMRFAEGVTTAQKTKRVRSATQPMIDAGFVNERVVEEFIATKPSWGVVNKLHWADEKVSQALISQTGIPVEDIANQALARNLVMEMHVASRGIDASDPIALQRTIEATRQRVINEMVQKVEVRYGSRVANQVNRQLNTPAVQNAIAVVTNPNTIPVNNQIVLVSDDGKQITGIFTPGSGRQMFATPGAGPVRVSQYSGSTTQTLTTPRVTFAPGSGRNQLPNGLTRRPTGEIVTVSRRVADDAVESAVSASQAADDARVTQQVLDVSAWRVVDDTPVVDATLPDPVLEDLLPPAPPRQTPDAFPEASVQQMKWLNLFSQRDGINHWDEMVAAGDTSQAAVIAKLRELDSSGKATAAQILKMGELGVTPSRRRELMQMPRQQVDAELRRLEQGAPRPQQLMTLNDYLTRFRNPQDQVYEEWVVSRAVKYGKEYNIDFLRRAVDEGWTNEMLVAALKAEQLPATASQRERIRDLIQHGRLHGDVKVDDLTVEQANKLIGQATGSGAVPNPVEAIMRHNAPAPMEVIDRTDVALAQASDAKIASQKKNQDYLRRHLPVVFNPAKGADARKGGFRAAVEGRKTDLGVNVMSPMAAKQFAIDHLDLGTFKDTDFEQPMEELARAILHVNSDGLLSSDTVSAHFEYVLKQIVELAGSADPDDSRRLIEALDEAYGGSRYADITAGAKRKKQNLPDGELAARIERANRQLPQYEADLADLRRKTNHDRHLYTPKQLEEFSAQKAYLETQQKKALDLTNPKKETVKQIRQRKRQEAADKVRSIAPTIGELPPVEAPQSMAGLASDHDIAKLLVEGNVPVVERNPVVSSQPTLLDAPTAADDAVAKFLNTAKGKQARNLFAADGNLLQIKNNAFAKAGTTREAVEAILRQESEQVARLVDQQEILDAFLEGVPFNTPFVNGLDDLPSAIRQIGEEMGVTLRGGDTVNQWVNRVFDRVTSRKIDLTMFHNPNEGLGDTFKFQPATAEQISERIGNLMSKYSKPGRPLPNWVRKEIRALESQIGNSQPWWHDAAGGGGLGIVDPRSQYVFDALGGMVPKRPRKLPNLIEPDADVWRSADWDAIGPQVDEWAKQFYDVDWILEQDNRLRIGGKELNPTALKKSARVAQAGDFMQVALSRWIADAHAADDPYKYITDLIEHWGTADPQEIVKSDRFFASQKGQETLRLIRRTYKSVLDDVAALKPHRSLTDMGPGGPLPMPTNGRYSVKQIQYMHDIINGRTTMRGMSDEAREQLYHLRQSNVVQKWNDEIVPLFFKEGSGWTDVSDAPRLEDELEKAKIAAAEARKTHSHLRKGTPEKAAAWAAVTDADLEVQLAQAALRGAKRNRGISGEFIDSILFDHSEDYVDVGKFANKIGTKVSDEYAKIIGYDPEHVPWFARPMMWVKSQLTPLWMTIMPTYHLNNIAGNFMAMVIEAARGRGHTGLIPRSVNPTTREVVDETTGKVTKLGTFDDPLSGWSWPRWITDPTQGRSQFTETAVAAADRDKFGRHRPALLKVKGKRIIGNTGDIIDFASGGRLGIRKGEHQWNGLATGGEQFGDWAETTFKKSIYSQEVWGEAPKLWRRELDTMLNQARITVDDYDKLVMAKGLHDIRKVSWQLDAPSATDELLARYRGVIGTSQHRAYTIAADAMRDYRMRNKIDGFLDQFLPVHFWATKNMLYVSKAAMDRPALAISAGQAFNAWEAEHKDDPLSIRNGYFRVPSEMIPFLPEGSEYWMRGTQLTNPLMFAVPKMIAGMNRDWNLAPEDQSLWDRVQYWGKNGMANFWEASGYRLGPQWDWAIKAANRLGEGKGGRTGDTLFALSYLSSPYTDYQGKRRPGQQSVLPLGGIESLLNTGLPWVDTGLDASVVNRFANELAFGSPYTNYEVSQAVLWMKQDTAVNFSPENQARLDAVLLAMAQGNFDDPYIQQAMSNVYANQSESFLRGRVGLHAGRERTVTDQRIDKAWDFYNTLHGAATHKAKWSDPSVLWEVPAELRWMIRDSGATQAQIDAAVQAASEGKDHPLLKRAYEATSKDDWAVADQTQFMSLIVTASQKWEQLAAKYGKEAANDAIFGTWNRNTGQREGGLMPGMEALMTVYTGDALQMGSDAVIDRARDNGFALRDRRIREGREESRKETPYFDRLARNDQALQDAVARANGDMRLVDLAYRAHSNIESKIYDEAEAAGLDLSPSGNMPREGRNYYTRTPEERQFLEWNGALEAVEGRERKQARQGFILNLVEQQLGVKKYDENGELNENFVTDGRFDQAKYDAAVAEAAEQAPDLFREIVEDYRTMSGEYIEMGVNGRGITSEDFLFHVGSKNPQLDAYREQKNADWAAWREMSNEKPSEKVARNAERERLVALYGDAPTLYEDGGGVTAAEHGRYGENIQAANNWYHSLSPADKAEFKERYGSAFEPATGMNEDGSTYEYDKFIPENLTAEQAQEIVARNDLKPGGTATVSTNGAGRSVITDTPQEVGAESVRRGEVALVESKKAEFDAALPEDLQMLLEMEYAHKQDGESRMIVLDGQEMSFEDAAQMLIDDPRAKTKQGYASWFKAAQIVGEDTELGQYILEKKRLGDEAKPADAAQNEWWNSQPDDVKEVLLREDPNTWGWLARRNGDSSGEGLPASGESSTPTATTTGGGSSYQSNYRPYTPYRSSGSSYRSGSSGFSGGSGAGSGDQPVLNQILSLDPFLSSGQDDGRLAIATQVSDHIQRMISVISMFAPDKRQAQFFTGLWMQLIGRMLGPNPDMAAWQNLLARLTKQQQTAPQMGTSPDVRGREPQVAVEQGDVTQQQRSTLGNY